MDIKTHIITEPDKAGLENLIHQYKYGRYCEDKSLPLESSQRLVFDRLLKLSTQQNSRVIEACSPSEELLGTLFFRLSQWDTDHFGFNVAIIEAIICRQVDYEHEFEIAVALVKEFLAWCRSSEIRFVSVRVPSLDLPVIHCLETWGFHFIENWIFNKYDLSRIKGPTNPPYQLRISNPKDCGFAVDYSRDAFSTQRFHADAHIARDKADSLYEKWILTAFNDPGQEILVLDINDRPAAFMIYYKSDLTQYFGLRYAMWKMALLNPKNRSRGLGTDFFISLMHHHLKDGLDVIDSGLSMRNLASLNLHNKLDFKVTSTIVTFHKWLDNE